MSIAAGYIATVIFAVIGFIISEEIVAGFDEWVLSRTVVLTDEDEDAAG